MPGKVRFQPVLQFLQLTRPLFLLGGVMMYLFGVVFAMENGHPFNRTSFIFGQITITIIQLMTHYLNEFYDLDSDAINQSRTWFSGGSGVLSAGGFLLKAAWILSVSLAAAAFCLILGIAVAQPLTAAFCLAGLVLSWFYSAPPLRLCASGAGELSASIVVTLLVPLVGYSLQSGGTFDPGVLIQSIPLFFIHFAMLIAFQIPDFTADQAVGKKTLAVRLGLKRAVLVHNCLLLAGYSAAGLLITRWPAAILLFASFPLAAWQILTIGRYKKSNPPGYLLLTLRALALFAFTSALSLAASFII
jgi:1,4-dihydroxy-2-naphthoate polyprenyltransferase